MKNKIIMVFALTIILCKHVIFLLLGDQAIIGTWDSWDSLTMWPRLLIDRGVVFAPLDSLVPGFMGGIPRVSLGSELNVIVLLNFIFPPFTAHALNTMLIALVGFSGMYLFLRDHLIRDPTLYWLVVAIATGFALFPFYPVGGISQSSIPLATYAIINIEKNSKARWQDWAIVCAIPFYSSLVFSYFFFLIIVFILAFRFVLVKKKIPKFILPAILMLVVFLLVEYRFVHSLVAATFTPHRTEFSSTDIGIMDMLKASIFVLLFGGNAPGVSAFVNHAIPLASLLLFIIWCSRSDKKAIKQATPWLLLVSGIILLHGAWNTAPINLLRNSFGLLNIFNFTRFTWLLTPILFSLMAFACECLLNQTRRNQKLLKILIVSLASAQCVILAPFTHDVLVQTTRGGPCFTYASYFSNSVFNEIAAEIDIRTGLQKHEYAVGSIGMEPIIASANGFNTIDGYSNNYPLEYKNAFRNVIVGELEKDETLREYFDDWGNRCYLFSSEAPRSDYTRDHQVTITNLSFNKTAMIELGCKFVFSAVEIDNHAALGWTYLFTSDHEVSAWIVRVYSIS